MVGSAISNPHAQEMLFLELLPLCFYVAYMFFSFCDGFGLQIARKIIWAVYFLLFSYLSFWISQGFDLAFIVGLSSLIAFILAWFQVKENKRIKSKRDYNESKV